MRHTVNVTSGATKLRDTRPGDFFVFTDPENHLSERGIMARTWSDEDDAENGAYCFFQVSDPENIWSGPVNSTILDDAVRILTPGESFTVTVGGGK